MEKTVAIMFFILVAGSNSLSSQNDSTFKIGLGYSYTFVTSYWFPNPANSPSVNIFYKKHELNIGPDVFSYDITYPIWQQQKTLIWAPHLAYAYHFQRPGKKFNLSINTDLQFVRYHSGLIQDLPWKYKVNENDETSGYTMQNNKVFSQSISLGLNFRLFKIARFYFIAGGSYVVYSVVANPDYVPSQANDYVTTYSTKGVKPVGFIKLGFSCDLYKFKKNR